MKFAHLADCHLGAFRDQKLRELNLAAFEKAIDECIFRKVDFVIIAGDLFHIHLPDLSVINQAVLKLRDLKQAGIPLYVIYGSHDYSPTEHSMIDILQSADLFTKVNVFEEKGGKLALRVFTDPKTGAKIVGMCARKLGLEKNYYELLDRNDLEKIEGFKIFVFHNAVSEYLTEDLEKVNSIPVSFFPKYFDYYAGGHIHITSKDQKLNHGWIVSPGAVFGSNYTDLERSVKDPNGFFVVEFEDKINNIEFVPIKVCDIQTYNVDVSEKNSNQADEILKKFISDNDFTEKVNLIRVFGRLSAGTVSDVDLPDFKKRISDQSLVAYFNTNKFESADSKKISVESESRDGIEQEVFSEAVSKSGSSGFTTQTALHLLKELREELQSGETKTNYESKMISNAMKIIDVNEN